MLRKLPLLILFFFAYSILSAQPDSLPDDDTTESIPSVSAAFAYPIPYFKGCNSLIDDSVEKRNCSNQALISFISKNLKMPKKSEEPGSVYVDFIIDEQGKVLNANILRGLTDEQNEAALNVVKDMPNWEPALLNGNAVRVKMTLPIRFIRKDESEFSNGFQLTWGTLKGVKIERDILNKYLGMPITVRDDTGNTLEINELMFERDRGGKFLDAQSRGFITKDMEKIVKKLRRGDQFTITATVQKKGQFFYVDKSFIIE